MSHDPDAALRPLQPGEVRLTAIEMVGDPVTVIVPAWWHQECKQRGLDTAAMINEWQLWMDRKRDFQDELGPTRTAAEPQPRPAEASRPPRVYIAGPYTLGDVAENVRAAIQAAEWVIEAGGAPYLPHLTHLWHLISPHDHAYWLALDLAWLRTCDCLLRLPGESRGADIEVAEAERLGMPVYEELDNRLQRFMRGWGRGGMAT